MDLLQAENVQKLIKFYMDNALNLAAVSGVEADAEIKIRIVPNKDKNVDAKFIVIGSGKVLIPGQEELIAQLSDAPAEEVGQAEEVPTVEAEIVKPGLEVVK